MDQLMQYFHLAVVGTLDTDKTGITRIGPAAQVPVLAETWWNWYQRRDKKKEKWAVSPHYLKSYFFFPPANQNCYIYIVFNYYVLFLFGSAVTISSIYLTMNPQSEEEIVNQFRKLTNTYLKLFCAHNSTFHIKLIIS